MFKRTTLSTYPEAMAEVAAIAITNVRYNKFLIRRFLQCYAAEI